MKIRQKATRSAAMAIASLAVAAVGGVVAASPAQAATCSSASCTGKNPHTTGCDSSGRVYTSESVYPASYMRVDLRHSTGCHVWWAHGTDDRNSIGADLKIERQLETPYGYYDIDVYSKSVFVGPASWYTAMVQNSSDDRVRACIYPSGGPDAYWHCTSWHY